MENAGFRPADVARLLNKSPGAISQYKSGFTNPSETVVQLLRRVVQEKLSPREGVSTPAELQNKLTELSDHDPAGFAAAQATIEALHRRLPPITRPRSKILAAADKIETAVQDSIRSARKTHPESSRG